MSQNLYAQFKKLLPHQPASRAVVKSVNSDGTLVVEGTNGISYQVLASIDSISEGNTVMIQSGRAVAKIATLTPTTFVF